MARSEHLIRYAAADAAGAQVALTIETTVYSYDGEDADAVVASVTTPLEQALAGRGRAWSAVPAGTPTPARGDKFPKASKPTDPPGQAGR